MSFYHGMENLTRRFSVVQKSFMQKDGLPFSEVLPEEEIQDAFDQEGVTFAQGADDVYTPQVTMWAFLSQVLYKEKNRSCLAAVSRVIVLLVGLGREPCAKNSGDYCRARGKLHEVVIERLALKMADGCEESLPEEWLWHGRHVKLGDGTTVSMPDTPANREEYPQQAGQKEGLGFPIARLFVLLSLGSAMLCGMAMGPYSGKETGESALLRSLSDHLDDDDILLTDRLLCSYFTIAMLLAQGCDFVSRLHQARDANVGRSKRLGKGDHLVVWTRPKKPAWMDEATYEEMPETITVRQLEVQVNQPGFRTDSLVVVTTLTDAKRYTKDDIAELYHQRWLVELDIRDIKVGLGMDVLRSKSPAMVRKEIWTCLLAYNSIRKSMLQAAWGASLSPRQLSFTNAMQTITASFLPLLLMDEATAEILVDVQVSSLTEQLVGNRPDRFEPRAVKRRPKPYRLLSMTREEARELLRRGIDPYAKQK